MATAGAAMAISQRVRLIFGKLRSLAIGEEIKELFGNYEQSAGKVW
jgi:hypothetical protein